MRKAFVIIMVIIMVACAAITSIGCYQMGFGEFGPQLQTQMLQAGCPSGFVKGFMWFNVIWTAATTLSLIVAMVAVPKAFWNKPEAE